MSATHRWDVIIDTPSCTNPTGAEGGYVCGNASYPNTPIPGHRYQCVNGTWVDLGSDQTNCPIGNGGINPLYIVAAIAVVGLAGVVLIAKRR